MPGADPSSEPVPRRSTGGVGRTLLGAALGFAVLGAAALVLTNDARWLRLGIVAALWAALVGAFAAARYRRDGAAGHDRRADLRRVYQLEIEREVAARREHELHVETDTRRRVEKEVRDEVRGELDGLRTELRNLRQNLEALLGGEVLVERVALRAESTRLRSLSDQSRAARSAERVLPHGQTPGSSHAGQWCQERPEPHRSDPSWAGRRGVEPAGPTELLPRYQVPAEPQHPAPVGTGHQTSAPLDFRPLRRPEPVSRPEPLSRPEPVSHIEPAAYGHGYGGRRQRAENEPATSDYTGRRRHADEDTGASSVDELLASYARDQPRSRHRRNDG